MSIPHWNLIFFRYFSSIITAFLNLPFLPTVGRPERDNTINVYLSEDYEDLIGEGNWHKYFSEQPKVFPRAEQRAYLATLTGVTVIAQPGCSVRDDLGIECCDKYNMVMVFTGMRLFHH